MSLSFSFSLASFVDNLNKDHRICSCLLFHMFYFLIKLWELIKMAFAFDTYILFWLCLASSKVLSLIFNLKGVGAPLSLFSCLIC